MTTNVKDYMRRLDNGRLIWDYHKIEEAGFPIVLIMSERGSKGKTFNAKEFIREKFESCGDEAYWMLNTAQQIEKEKRNFLKNNRIVNPVAWEEYHLQGEKVYKDDRPVIHFVACSRAEHEKGSRNMNIKRIFYDEFNVGLHQLSTKQTSYLMSLLGTSSETYGDGEVNPLKLYIFGNNKTLATPLMVDLKINYIESEITYINKGGIPFMLILSPFGDEDEIRETHRNNWLYHMADTVGEADHMFGNSTLFDNMNGVIRDVDKDNLVISHFYSIDKRLIAVANRLDENGVRKAKEYYCFLWDGKPPNTKSNMIMYKNNNDSETGYWKLSSASIQTLRDGLGKGWFYFDSVNTKKLVCSLL